VAGAQRKINEHYAKHFPTLEADKLTVSFGKRYVKVIAVSGDRTGGGRRVYCFVDQTNGDVLKAASWKAPAKHARGNVYDKAFGLNGVTEHGGVYLR
jgi:hypothetical protein